MKLERGLTVESFRASSHGAGNAALFGVVLQVHLEVRLLPENLTARRALELET
jgi:hypothetical protein